MIELPDNGELVVRMFSPRLAEVFGSFLGRTRVANKRASSCFVILVVDNRASSCVVILENQAFDADAHCGVAEFEGRVLRGSGIVGHTLFFSGGLFLEVEVFLEVVDHVAVLEHGGQCGVARGRVGIAHETADGLDGGVGGSLVFVFRVADLGVAEHDTHDFVVFLVVVEIVVEHNLDVGSGHKREP